MSVIVSDEIRLDEVIPLIERLSDVEREELRQILEVKPKIDWQVEWEQAAAYFHSIFQKFSEEEVEADLDKALREVRSGKTD